MARVLFLAHRIPYPPVKGDKIRSWHFLRHLAASHEVSLACFVDDPGDMAHADVLRGICTECHFEPVPVSPVRLGNLLALANGTPITVRHYRNATMMRRVAEIARSRDPGLVFAYSGAMAQYLPAAGARRRVIDFADVDSDKWAQYARSCPPATRWIYRREARTLLGFERSAATAAEASIFVSETEAALFRELAPEAAGRIHAVRNGVDSAYFSPDHVLESPFPEGAVPIVFTGMMNYWANVDGAQWFCDAVLPKLRARTPKAEFWIVGAAPTPAVSALARLPGVHVTGRVADVRPYLRHAVVVAAPLRIARGVQNKILEAMAMARAVVTTPGAAEGVDGATVGHELEASWDPGAFADAIATLIEQPAARQAMGERARARVLREYDWGGNLATLDRLLFGGPGVS
jgi:sugar transferase (PEP-CTERM/EpsH1 system associated)